MSADTGLPSGSVCGRDPEENGDGFSDISDSELLTLQDESDRDTNDAACVSHKNVQSSEEVVQSSGNTDEHKDTTDNIQHDEKQQISENPECSKLLQRKRKYMPTTPLQKYKMKYLCVTDLCSQMWCEQQMVYGYEIPELEQEKPPVMNAGASIHLARELELHDVVSVKTQTKEDVWAIKFLNVLSMIPILQSGGNVREFPVFRELEGVLLVGVIDELGYTSKGQLELRELKTRANPSLPGCAQSKQHNFQVSVYKILFDGMVMGLLQPEIFVQHLHLRLDQKLGPQVADHSRKVGLTVSTFGDILELICLNLRFSELPMIDCLKLEYCYQEDSSLLGCEMLNFEEQNVMDRLHFLLSYWKGGRELQGVDIEEAWKCRTCSFVEICEWRNTKAKEAIDRNQTKRGK
ncbi:exonuclease V [Bombina bombina]|uniref:exonuclease V n=1 Tax=Bombina bombina TaxID=8345 RepID=UPI00235A875C|nr:exonuclease V [Bombina bombina]